MDALKLLIADHAKVRQLFRCFESSRDEGEHRQIFNEIKTELEIHTHVEETVFYPAVQKHENLADLVREALEEHKKVKHLIQEIDRLNKQNGEIRPRVAELIKNVEHHATEEETEMFPKVREVTDEAQLQRMGQELESVKRTHAPIAA